MIQTWRNGERIGAETLAPTLKAVYEADPRAVTEELCEGAGDEVQHFIRE